MSGHTPTPFVVVTGRDGSVNITSGDMRGAYVCLVGREKSGADDAQPIRHDAHFIVTACNNHDALLAALKAVTEHMDRAGGDMYGTPECPWCRSGPSGDEHASDCELLAARAAIARAESR